jgi:outer membrane translocation and assembly module TamA
MTILVWNSLDRPIHLKSFDGDSVLIGPKARAAQVAQKFNWNPPSNVKIVDQGPDSMDLSKIVNGPMPHMHRKPPKSYNRANMVSNAKKEEILLRVQQKKKQKEAAAQFAALKKAAEKPENK